MVARRILSTVKDRRTWAIASLDIFLIAILIFIGKTFFLIDVNLSSGFYFLCFGIIMGLLQIDKIVRSHFSDESLSDKGVE